MQIDQRTYERFAASFCPEPNSGCWLWMGAYDGAYGILGAQKAHRVAHRLFKGPIPEGWHVHHACCVTICVNPSHLEAISPNDHPRVTYEILRAQRQRAAAAVSKPSVDQIIDLCGGPEAIAAALKISPWAIYKWPEIGIHTKNWDAIISQWGVSIADIYHANRAARFREEVAAA